MVDSQETYSARYRTFEDEEFIKILRGMPGEYVAPAIAAAKQEFLRRGHSVERIRELAREEDRRLEERMRKSDEPLPAPLKILCFVLGCLALLGTPFVTFWAGAGLAFFQLVHGRRRFRESWKALLGILTAAVVALLFHRP